MTDREKLEALSGCGYFPVAPQDNVNQFRTAIEQRHFNHRRLERVLRENGFPEEAEPYGVRASELEWVIREIG